MGFLLEMTGETSPTGVGIRAYVEKNGRTHITLFQVTNRDKFMLLIRRQMEASRNVADWQSGWVASPQEAAAMIMEGFGMAWFNRARQQLSEIGWKPERAA